MNTEKPIESHTAADFLQYAIENPIHLPQEEESEERGERVEESGPDDKLADSSEGERLEAADPSAIARDDNNEEELDSESEDRDESDEDDPTDDEDEAPQLDPLIEELAKGNPNAEKRVKEIAQGLQKLKTESKQLKSDLENTKPKSDAWDTYQKALEDPMFAGPTLERLIEAVASFHGLPIDELMGGAKAPRGVDVLESGDRSPHSINRLEQELRMMRRAMDGLQKERAEAQQRAEFKNYVDEIAPKTIRRLEKLENGWKVSKGMVERAIKEFPQLRNDPMRAVKAAFADELKAHYAKQASNQRKQRGPEMLPDTRGKGQTLKPPLQTTAADVYAMLE